MHGCSLSDAPLLVVPASLVCDTAEGDITLPTLPCRFGAVPVLASIH